MMADPTEAEVIAARLISRAKHAGTYVEPKFVLVDTPVVPDADPEPKAKVVKKPAPKVKRAARPPAPKAKRK
jgi:hypothetical protein